MEYHLSLSQNYQAFQQKEVVEIFVDKKTGNRYSVNSKSGETKWLDDLSTTYEGSSSSSTSDEDKALSSDSDH